MNNYFVYEKKPLEKDLFIFLYTFLIYFLCIYYKLWVTR